MKYLLIIIFLTPSLHAFNFQESPLKLSQLETVEIKLEEYLKRKGKNQIEAQGKSNNWDLETHYLTLLFPYLLPESFPGKNLYMECYLDLKSYTDSKKSYDYRKWNNCIQYKNGNRPHAITKKILKELAP